MRAFPPFLSRHLKNAGRGLTVLVVRLGAMGDVVRTLPPVRLLRAGLPEARILWAVDERWRSLLEEHPDLDLVVPLPREQWRRRSRALSQWPSLARSVRQWSRDLRSHEPSLVLDFHGTLRSAIVALLSGASVRLGYSGYQQKEGNRLFTTHRVPARPRRISRMERNLNLVRALGIPVEPLPGGGFPENPQCTAAAHSLASRAAGQGRPYAVVSAGASRAQSYKKPPPRLLAAAARRLCQHGIAALVVYGPGEETDALAVVEAAGGKAAITAPTDLPTLAALLRDARMFVGGDSGPLHVACATGCPVLGVYGPTDPVVNAPWGAPRVALHPPGRTYTGIKRKDRRAGFEGLEEDAVEAAVAELLSRTAQRPQRVL